MSNSYNTYINQLYTALSGYQDYFLGIDEIIEDIPSGYVIRPSFTFGTYTDFSNLRSIEENIILTLQLYQSHDDNTDLISKAEDIKKQLFDFSVIKVSNYYYSITKIEFQKTYDSKFNGISILIYLNKM